MSVLGEGKEREEMVLMSLCYVITLVIYINMV